MFRISRGCYKSFLRRQLQRFCFFYRKSLEASSAFSELAVLPCKCEVSTQRFKGASLKRCTGAVFRTSRPPECSGGPKCVQGCSEIFQNIQQCSGVLREVDFGSHWETQREPNEAFFAYSCNGFSVFKKARISRCFEAHVILRFSENSKVQF